MRLSCLAEARREWRCIHLVLVLVVRAGSWHSCRDFVILFVVWNSRIVINGKLHQCPAHQS